MALTLNSCKEDAPIKALTPKEEAIKLYEEAFLASETNASFNEDVANCVPGTLDEETLRKVLLRVNYFRRANKLPDVEFRADLNAKCQAGALMLRANNALNHNPPTSWKCYTAEGAEACAKGNIYLGYHTSSSIDGFVMDPGANNTAVGHRRWILYSRGKTFGHGSTVGSSILYVIGNSLPTPPANLPEFISWPPKGYVINSLVYPRWSISVPKADFSGSTVTMTGPAGAISLNLLPIKNGYGDNTLAWEPAVIDSKNANDITYQVVVDNVLVDGATKKFEYQVILTNPNP